MWNPLFRYNLKGTPLCYSAFAWIVGFMNLAYEPWLFSQGLPQPPCKRPCLGAENYFKLDKGEIVYNYVIEIFFTMF